MTSQAKPSGSRGRRVLRVGVVAALVLVTAYVVFNRMTSIEPPSYSLPAMGPLRFDGGVTRSGSSFLAKRGKLWVLGLEGRPITIGFDHGRLASPLMAEGDATMLALYARYVPSRFARGAIDILVRAKNRNLAAAFPEARRREVYGESLGYHDRFAAWMPTFQRLVYLHGLYDVSLAFEQSPLLGCTSFFATRGATRDGHTIVGRNFDFDVDPWFDREKVVQLVRVHGSIPYLSVSWPGMTGVVSGMNAEGVWVAVHGARGGEREGEGTPVVFTTRAILEHAHTIDEAIAIALRDRPMVPHMLVIADGDDGGSAVVIERAPGRESAVVRATSDTMGFANHYRSAALRGDERNRAVRDGTSTVARGARMDELLREGRGRIDPATGVAMLRDRRASATKARPLGHRAAIDGLLAAHGVVADLTARVVWVSESPHLLGRFVRFDVGAIRTADGLARAASAADGEGAIAADPIAGDGTYARVRLGARWRSEAAALLDDGDVLGAAQMVERAIALREDDHEAWRLRAEIETARARGRHAREAWRRYAELDPPSPAEARRARARADGIAVE